MIGYLFRSLDRSPAAAVGIEGIKEVIVRTGERWEIETFVANHNRNKHEEDHYRVRPLNTARTVYVVEPKQRAESVRIEKTMDGLHWKTELEARAALVHFELDHPETVGKFQVLPARLEIQGVPA